MKATTSLQRAVAEAARNSFAAGPSRPLARSLVQPRSLPSCQATFVPSTRSNFSALRPFTTSHRRHSDRETYSDTPEGYSRPSSSRSSGPWYRSPTTLILGFIPIFTFSLGYWQIKRLSWKVSLIEELEDKLSRDPLRLPRNINIDVLPEFDFRLVQVQGSFDYSRAMMVGPRVRDGTMGYHVVVPLRRREGGGCVLVNRGFIAEKELKKGKDGRWEMKDEVLQRLKAEREGEFVALLPRIYPGNMFTPKNVPEKGNWFHVEPKQMADWASGQAGVEALSLTPHRENEEQDSYTPSAGVAESVKHMLGGSSREEERVLPVYLEEVFDGNVGEAATRIAQGIPVGRAATIELRNQHAVYAATWFSLSAATALMFGILVRRGRG